MLMARYQLLVLPGLCLPWGLWLDLEAPFLCSWGAACDFCLSIPFHFCESLGLPHCPFSPSLGGQGPQSDCCLLTLMRDLTGLSLLVQVHTATRGSPWPASQCAINTLFLWPSYSFWCVHIQACLCSCQSQCFCCGSLKYLTEIFNDPCPHC